MPDGSPHSVLLWVGREENHILICTSEHSRKPNNTLLDPRIALSVVDLANTYGVRNFEVG